MKLPALLLSLAITLGACGGGAARGSFCAATKAALAPAQDLDLTVGSGVVEYRALLLSVETLAGELDAADRAVLAPELDAVIAALDASLAGRGVGWSSQDLMTILWDWCGEDVGLAYTVQP